MTTPRINQAVDVIEYEADVLSTECQAFEQFLSYIDMIQPSMSPSTTTSVTPDGGVLVCTGNARNSASSVQDIRNAYQESVMDVPHFESEYNDTFKESVAIEFGPDIANGLMTATSVTSMLKTALYTAAKEAQSQRRRVLGAVRQERRSLIEIRKRLTEIEDAVKALEHGIAETVSSRELSDIDSQLSILEEECQKLIGTREQVIQNRVVRATPRRNSNSLHTYLYDHCEFQFPALGDIAEYVERIQHLRMDCLW